MSLGLSTHRESDLDHRRCPTSLVHSGSLSSSANTVGNFNRQCLSCDLVENCTYFSASFSHSADYFLLQCEGEWLLPGHSWVLGARGHGEKVQLMVEWVQIPMGHS